MKDDRLKFISAVGATVLILIIAVVVTIATNTAENMRDRASSALAWTIVIGLLGVLICVMIEVYFAVKKPKPLVEVIEDEVALKKRYEEMRTADGNRRIQAIWSARYVDVETYFKNEGSFLTIHPDVEIERLVNPDVIPPKSMEQFNQFIDIHPNLKVWATDVNEFECFICEYLKGGVVHLKALLVLNDTMMHTPQLGIYMDSEKSAAIKPLAYALQSWFLRLPRNPFPGASTAESVWEARAPLYDKNVTSTALPVLRHFIDREQQLLAVNDIAGKSTAVSVIEIGSGTGRTLLDLAKNRTLIPNLAYLIGIDDSYQMNRIAIAKREALIAPDEVANKMFFFLLDARKLSEYFSRGEILIDRVKRDLSDSEPVNKIDPKIFKKSPKVICCLLNTLGVLEKGTRIQTIRNIVSAAGSSDTLVFSVFNGESFSKYAPELYNKIRDLVGQVSADDFNHQTHEFRTRHYYSQWFDKKMLSDALTVEGCCNVKVEPIHDSGYFVTCNPSPSQ